MHTRNTLVTPCPGVNRVNLSTERSSFQMGFSSCDPSDPVIPSSVARWKIEGWIEDTGRHSEMCEAAALLTSLVVIMGSRDGKCDVVFEFLEHLIRGIFEAEVIVLWSALR